MNQTFVCLIVVWLLTTDFFGWIIANKSNNSQRKGFSFPPKTTDQPEGLKWMTGDQVKFETFKLPYGMAQIDIAQQLTCRFLTASIDPPTKTGNCRGNLLLVNPLRSYCFLCRCIPFLYF